VGLVSVYRAKRRQSGYKNRSDESAKFDPRQHKKRGSRTPGGGTEGGVVTVLSKSKKRGGHSREVTVMRALQ